MKREEKLVKNAMIYAIGNILSKCVGFILLPMYTAYLSPKDYGYFDLVMTTLTLLVPIVTFQLSDGIYRYLLDAKNNDEINRIISTSFWMIIRNILITNLIYLIITNFVYTEFRYQILIIANLSIIYAIWAQITRGLKRNVEYAMSGLILTAVSIVSNILLILFTNLRIEALFISTIIANIVVIAYIEYRVKIIRFIKFSNYDKNLLKYMVLYSLPLLANSISWWIMNVSDRYLINCFIGIEGNGIYAIANKFPSLLVMLSGIFTLAWQETAITENNSDDRDVFYTKMFNSFMKFQFSGTLVLMAFTKMTIDMMINNSYQDSWKYIPFLYLAAIFNSFAAFYGVGYQVSKQTKGAFYTSVQGAIVNFIVNIILIRYLGLYAASLSTLLGFLVMWLARIIQTKRYFKIRIDRLALFILSLCMILFIILYYLDNFLINLLLIIISILIFIIANFEIIKKFITIINTKFIKISKEKK